MRDPCGERPPLELLQGVGEFNRRQFFECHETLEALWRREAGPVRGLYQGILLVGVGFYHLRRGNYPGARKCFARGMACLLGVGPVCQGVRVEELRARTRVAMELLHRLGPERIEAFDMGLIPTIEIETDLAVKSGPSGAPGAAENEVQEAGEHGS